MRWEEKRGAKRIKYMRWDEKWSKVKWSDVKVFVAWVQHSFIVTHEWHCTVCGSTVCTFALELFVLCPVLCFNPLELLLSFLLLFYCFMCFAFYFVCSLILLFLLMHSAVLANCSTQYRTRRVPLFYWFIYQRYVNLIYYTTPKYRIIMNDEWARKWQQLPLTCFKE